MVDIKSKSYPFLMDINNILKICIFLKTKEKRKHISPLFTSASLLTVHVL
jgi:hypothetical protein